jgi:cytochrome c biogenesis protein CcmG/thiol:disulfide interchange protein DsbE
MWASWCVPCGDEAPILMLLAADPRIRIISVHYKDQPENAIRFLARYGNPLIANGVVPPRRLRHIGGIGLFTPA